MLGAADPELPEVDAGVQRVDRGHELELGVVEHRPADRGAHAARRAEHTDLIIGSHVSVTPARPRWRVDDPSTGPTDRERARSRRRAPGR